MKGKRKLRNVKDDLFKTERLKLENCKKIGERIMLGMADQWAEIGKL